MKPLAILYVDAPQHFRIATTLIGALGGCCDVVLLATLPVPTWFNAAAGTELAQTVVMRPPTFGAWLRPLQLLMRGLVITIKLGRYLRSVAPAAGRDVHLVVFNDTGIAQRYLIARGNRRHWATVLVQDGLTDTQYRERGRAFALKQSITTWLLAPLGLGYLGTTRYGTAGARTILADGPAAAEFFRSRAPNARIVQSGLLRPCPSPRPNTGPPHVLFWAVDFLGGLRNRSLHELQLRTVEALAAALTVRPVTVHLRVRMHPGDATYFDEFRERLGGLARVELIDPARNSEQFAAELPVVSLSLQSAGVFDALAARVPSFFLCADGRTLGPSWTPPALLLADVSACAGQVHRLLDHPGTGAELWQGQINALQSRLQIPFDADAIRAAFG